MSKKNRPEAVTTFLGADARIEGTIEFDGTIRIDGEATGRIYGAGGTLIVGEGAVVSAEIRVDSAILMGEVTGTVAAANRIEAHPPSQINGDLQAPVVSIEAGVVFSGTCVMKPVGFASLSTPKGEAPQEVSDRQ